jgi:hypothetical protein
MDISTVAQRGSNFHALNAHGSTIFVQTGDRLHGYTSTTMTVQRGENLYTYDVRGRMINQTRAR